MNIPPKGAAVIPPSQINPPIDVGAGLNVIGKVGTFGPTASEGLIGVGNYIMPKGTTWIPPSRD
jgi:hypothetical protein